MRYKQIKTNTMKLLTNNFTGTLSQLGQAYRIGMKSTPDAVIITVYLEDFEEGGFLTEEVIHEYINENQNYNDAFRKALTQVEISYGIKLIKAQLTNN